MDGITSQRGVSETNRAKAYSYLRFSTPDQMRGDSFRRQSEAARDYAERNGLDLDTGLTFRDLGVSAFRGANAADGALGKFIDAVDTGLVEPGSYLLVENLDRLSRDKIMSALNRFSSLLEKGVNIVTLSDGKTYTADSLNNLPDLMLSLLVMSRAHEESKLKGERVRAAWQNKKKRAAAGEHVLTAKVPAWLELNDGVLEVISERAEIVQRIFALTLKGWGKSAIAREFNTEGVPTFGKAKSWHASYIQKILRNEAVIGRCQPMRNSYDTGRMKRVPDGDPIDNYFPPVVSEVDFYRVKHSKPGPSGKGQALPQNELAGIAFCGRCGGRMHYVNKGNPPKGGKYLACDNARRKKTCDAKSVRYESVIVPVLGFLKDYRSLHQPVDTQPKPDYDPAIDALSADIAKIERGISRLLDTLQRVPSDSAERRLLQSEARLTELKARKAELEEKRLIGNSASDGIETMLAQAEWVDELDPGDFRATEYQNFLHRVQEIRRVVEKVVVEKDEPVRVVQKAHE